MKLAFIDVKYKKAVVLPQDFIAGLPSKIILFTNIQLNHQYASIKKQLKNAGKQVVTVRPKHSWNEGQLLGCGTEDWSEHDVDGFVYIGDGLFHPKALLFKNAKPVHIYDPVNETQRVLEQKEIEKLLKRQKGALVTFHTARQIGVVITTKYGQNRLKEALQLEEKFPEKTFYYLMDDVINFNSLQDFPFIECFINTACPRVMDDADKFPKPVLNIAEILEMKW